MTKSRLIPWRANRPHGKETLKDTNPHKSNTRGPKLFADDRLQLLEELIASTAKSPGYGIPQEIKDDDSEIDELLEKMKHDARRGGYSISDLELLKSKVAAGLQEKGATALILTKPFNDRQWPPLLVMPESEFGDALRVAAETNYSAAVELVNPYPNISPDSPYAGELSPDDIVAASELGGLSIATSSGYIIGKDKNGKKKYQKANGVNTLRYKPPLYDDDGNKLYPELLGKTNHQLKTLKERAKRDLTEKKMKKDIDALRKLLASEEWRAETREKAVRTLMRRTRRRGKPISGKIAKAKDKVGLTKANKELTKANRLLRDVNKRRDSRIQQIDTLETQLAARNDKLNDDYLRGQAGRMILKQHVADAMEKYGYSTEEEAIQNRPELQKRYKALKKYLNNYNAQHAAYLKLKETTNASVTELKKQIKRDDAALAKAKNRVDAASQKQQECNEALFVEIEKLSNGELTAIQHEITAATAAEYNQEYVFEER